MPSKRDDSGLLGPLFDHLEEDEPVEQEDDGLEPSPPVYSVTELAHSLRDNLRKHYPLVHIRGEIADFKGVHRSGHLYFSLKDDKSQIRAVMWRHAVSKLPFKVEGGQEVLVTAKVDFYPGGGSLQVSVEHMEPVGIGALQLKYEQLKKKLQEEGLFSPDRKREISPVNWRIGIVTGRSTAAFQDMLKIFRHRFPLAEVFLFHASVQGEQAPAQIISAIETANNFSAASKKKLGCLIVGRGGGSYEDLFCFNDEGVARAIVNSGVPVISGVGHEIDVTIADMVADKRAATPTHAAQLCVPDIMTWVEKLELRLDRMTDNVNDRIFDYRQKIDVIYNRLVAASPQKRLQVYREKLDAQSPRLERAILQLLEKYKQRVSALGTQLDALSPLKVFERGYAVIQDDSARIFRSVKELKKDDIVTLRLQDGTKKTRVL